MNCIFVLYDCWLVKASALLVYVLDFFFLLDAVPIFNRRLMRIELNGFATTCLWTSSNYSLGCSSSWDYIATDASCEDIEVTCSMILSTTSRTYIFGWIVSFMSFNARSFIASLMLSPMKFMLCYQSNKHYTVFVQHIVCTM